MKSLKKLLVICMAFVATMTANAQNLKVGAARESIDVPADWYPMPTHFDPVQALYDSCYVRAIAMESGKEKTLLLVYELSDYPSIDNFEEKLAKATGFPKEGIIATVTHNHTSLSDSDNPWRPSSDPADNKKKDGFKDIELNQGIKCAKEAIARMKPARVGFGTIDSYVNVNRDYKSRNGYWIEAPNYQGYSPKTMSILKFVDDNGKLITALLNYGCHNTSAFELPDFDGKVKTSGNMSGIACKLAEKHYGDGTVIVWTPAAGGDQNPIVSHGIWYEDADGFITEKQMPNGVPYLFMESLGRTHGSDAIKGIDAITNYSDATLGTAATAIGLPAQKKLQRVEPRMGWKGDRDYTKVPYGKLPPTPNFDQYYTDDPEHPVHCDMRLLTIGNTSIIFTNAELYSRLGTEIKEESPYQNKFVVCYSLSPSTSYVIDKASVDHKVFQAYDRVKPGKSDDILLSTANQLYSRLKNN